MVVIMKSFKIYAELGNNPDTEHFKEFMKSVENRINNDPEIIARAKAGNAEFAKKISEILANEENSEFIGGMIAELQKKHSRYSYIKGLEFDGREYEAEIDELERKFYLHDVGEK